MDMNRHRQTLITCAAALLLGFSAFVMSRVMARYSFHPDEAFYTSYSKDILNKDFLLTARGLDKPPVFFYVQAAFMGIFGEGPVTSRMPNVLALLATQALLFVMVGRIFGSSAALFTLLFLCGSPLLLLYGPTAFTDMIALLCGVWSLERLTAKRWMASGVLATIAAFTKQYFGLFALYGVAAMILIPSLRPARNDLKAWAKGLFYSAVPFILWETFCNRPAWFMVTNGKTAYERWQNPIPVLDSIKEWFVFYQKVLGADIINGLVVIGLVALVLLRARDLLKNKSLFQEDSACWDLFFTGWLISYFLLIALQPRIPRWERYLIPGAIPLCILAGRLAAETLRRIPQRTVTLITFFGIFLIIARFAAAQVVGKGPDYGFGANYDASSGLPEMLREAIARNTDNRHVVFLEESGFFPRYYAYRAKFPIRAIDVQPAAVEFKRFLFSPVYVISTRSLSAQTFSGLENSPFELQARAASGRYSLWSVEPSPVYRRPLTTETLKTALQAITEYPAKASLSKNCANITIQTTIREQIPAEVTACWKNPAIYEKLGRYALEGTPQTAVVRVFTQQASAALQRKNPKVLGLRITTRDNHGIQVSGELSVAHKKIPFSLSAVPTLTPSLRIGLMDLEAQWAGRRLAPSLCRLIEKFLPPQKVGLPYWVGSIHKISIEAPDVLSFETNPHALKLEGS